MGLREIILGGLFFVNSLYGAEIVSKYSRQFYKNKTPKGDIYIETGPSFDAEVITKKQNKLHLEDVTFFRERWHGGDWYEGKFYCKSIDVIIKEVKFNIPFKKIKKMEFFWNDSALIYLRNNRKIKVKKVGLFWERNRDFYVIGEVYNKDLDTTAEFKEREYYIKSIEFKQKDKDQKDKE